MCCCTGQNVRHLRVNTRIKVSVAEMKVLCWMCGKTIKDRIINGRTKCWALKNQHENKSKCRRDEGVALDAWLVRSVLESQCHIWKQKNK